MFTENDELKEKLDYIGLDFGKLPKTITEAKKPSFSPSDSFPKDARVFMYVPISNIDILITKHSSAEDLTKKYNDSITLGEFFNTSGEDYSHEATFANMLKHCNLEIMDDITKEQAEFLKEPPFNVTYDRSSLWNIYYSTEDDRYFMIVCTDDNDFSTFFYLLREQIMMEKGNNKERYIYVPILAVSLSYSLLPMKEVQEMENHLWYFTSFWPITYEQYDRKGKMKMVVVGRTKVYKDLISMYRIELSEKEDAKKYYKFVKALFEIDQGTKGYISFKPVINTKCGLSFKKDNIAIQFEDLPNILSVEYEKIFKDLLLYQDQLGVKEKKRDLLKDEKQNKEQLLDDIQNEVLLFNNTVTSFFGKLKYFFNKSPLERIEELEKERMKQEKEEKDLAKSSKKKTKGKRKEKSQDKEKNNKNSSNGENEKEYNNKATEELKEKYKLSGGFCTISEYVDIYSAYNEITKKYSDYIKDINSIRLVIENLDRKIANAKDYLKDISENKSNIITFFKYTNKDNLKKLPENAIEKEELIADNTEVNHLSGVFDLEIDFETFGQNMDKKQRKLLEKDEIASVFLTTDGLLRDINIVKEGLKDDLSMDILVNSLKSLEEEFLEKEGNIQKFDIFGENTSEQDVRYLKDKSFRETDRDKFKILKYISGLSKEEYIRKLEIHNENIKKAISKINTGTNMVVYKIAPWSANLKKKHYDIYNLDLENEIYNISKEDNTFKLFVLNLDEKANAVFFTNIIFYNNNNETLPDGMDVSSQLILDMEKLDMVAAHSEEVRIVRNVSGKYKPLKIQIYEYNMKK